MKYTSWGLLSPEWQENAWGSIYFNIKCNVQNYETMLNNFKIFNKNKYCKIGIHGKFELRKAEQNWKNISIITYFHDEDSIKN
jgi:hypothetical protein